MAREKLLKIRLEKWERDLAEQAALAAGYKPSYARRRGSELLRTPRIRYELFGEPMEGAEEGEHANPGTD